MPDNAQAEAAINGMNEKPLSGRAIRVNEAKPRESGRVVLRVIDLS